MVVIEKLWVALKNGSYGNWVAGCLHRLLV